MGWDSCRSWSKKSDVVASQLRSYEGGHLKVVEYKSTTNGLWLVVENPDTGLRAIFFDLIKKECGSWGVKSMSEAMGPYYYDCPGKFLDMVPPVADKAFEYNLTWRAQYRAVRDGA